MKNKNIENNKNSARKQDNHKETATNICKNSDSYVEKSDIDDYNLDIHIRVKNNYNKSDISSPRISHSKICDNSIIKEIANKDVINNEYIKEPNNVTVRWWDCELKMSRIAILLHFLAALLSILALVAAIWTIFQYYEFDNIVNVEIKKDYSEDDQRVINSKVLTIQDRMGKIKNISFKSNIKKTLLCDFNSDGKNEVLIGFDSKGDDTNKIVAINHRGEILWTFQYPYRKYCPYPTDPSSFLLTRDIYFSKYDDKGQIAVIMADGLWYPSVLFILSPEGELLKSGFWNSGVMFSINQVKDKYIISGLNNFLTGEEYLRTQKYVNVVFGVSYNNIRGAFPWGPSKPYIKSSVDWYRYLTPPGSRIENINIIGDSLISFWVEGKLYLLNSNGTIKDTARGDNSKASVLNIFSSN